MIKILIVDDEKIERDGLKYLLSDENNISEICEASNGKQALQILHDKDIDLLLTDIKMPHMDGLELVRRAKEENRLLQVIIFSGYNEFSFAQEAIRYGVKDYVLKPVDPENFHNVIHRATYEIMEMKEKEFHDIQGQNFLQQNFLSTYLYSGQKEVLNKAEKMIDIEKWNVWHCGILIESDQAFFDTAEETLADEMQKELRRVFFYLNLNGRQSLLLFQDIYCDYQLVANHIYQFLKRNYKVGFYLAVSRKFEGVECLPDIMDQLEQQLEKKFYHPEQHVYTYEEDSWKLAGREVQDAHLMQMISEDIGRRDVENLRKHFECLKEKYRVNTQFSAMYIKFVFSNVIQELYQGNQFAGEKRLEAEIDRLYSCQDILQILDVTEENIQEFEEYVKGSMNESRNEVASVKNYIYQHYDEDLSLETLAEKVYLSSGYLSFIFKKETGMNLNRFIRVVRMEKAKELLCGTDMKVAQVSEKVGFANVSYFCRSFREYYGKSPESYRKGTNEDE